MRFKGSPELEDFWRYLECESPRGKTIVIAAYFDEKLGMLLGKRYRTFESRIDRGLEARLLTPYEHHDLHAIRKLRNDFAHNLAVKDFDPSRSQIVNELKTWRVVVEGLPQYETLLVSTTERIMYVAAVISMRLRKRRPQVSPPLPEPEVHDHEAWLSVSSH